MPAFRRNTSLEKVVSFFSCYRMEPVRISKMFDIDQGALLEQFAARNKALPLLLAAPGSIPIEVWPSIFESVKDCYYGPDIIYRALHALVKEGILTSPTIRE